tara:strand:+ start:5763 stop:8213 length:2451 start_codon:yes stop_codon:yes gene_type:complete
MALLSSDQNPLSGYSYPLSEEARAALEKEKEENEENEVGFDPLRAAALSAGGSLLRNSGWRNTPMSLGEGIGHAIPAGMQAYYNQDAMNQNEQQDLYERQQAEQTALDAKQKVEDDASKAGESLNAFETILKELFPNDRSEQRRYRLMYQAKPWETQKLLEERLTAKKAKADNPTFKKGLNPLSNKEEFSVITMDEKTGLPKVQWTGITTGDVSGNEKFLNEIYQFETTYGLSKRAQTFTEESQLRKDAFEEKKFQRSLFKTDREFSQALRKYEHDLIQVGVKNGFEEDKILQSAYQFRKKYDQDGTQFDQDIDLRKKIFKAKTQQWSDKFTRDGETDKRDHKTRLREHEDKIIQEGIKNNYTEQQMETQVTQFYENLNLRSDLHETEQNLKERIFKHKTDADTRNFNEQKNQFGQNLSATSYRFGKTFDYNVSESARKQGNLDRNFQQGIVEHLALLQDRGTKNGMSADKIVLAQRKFLESQNQYIDEKSFRDIKYEADVDYRAGEVARKVEEFEYQQGRDDKGDVRKDDAWKQKLKAYKNGLIDDTIKNSFQREGLELRRDIFEADVIHKQLKLATEGNQAPQTLTGKEAEEWAADVNNNFKLPEGKTGLPVIKINKHGQFASLDYIDSEQRYKPIQLQTLSKVNDKWLDSPDVKGGRKIARLARSLKALTDNNTGVSEFAMIYKFMKSLDETSTVLASEFRNARQAGLSAFDALELWGDQKMTGKQLDDDQKMEIVESVRTIAYQRLSEVNDIRESLIERATNTGVSREDAEKMMPNPLQEYFDDNPYTGSTGNVDGNNTLLNPDSDAIDKLK